MSLQFRSNFDIGLLSMEGDHGWKPLLHEEYSEGDPQISPDGRWMAYMSDESEQIEVYLRPFPDVDKGKWDVSVGGGRGPRWSPNGRELFYNGPDGLMAVSVATDPVVKLGTPKSLFSHQYWGWDISSDGKRFLAIKTLETIAVESSEEEPAPYPRAKINIVLNWFEELKDRVPVD